MDSTRLARPNLDLDVLPSPTNVMRNNNDAMQSQDMFTPSQDVTQTQDRINRMFRQGRDFGRILFYKTVDSEHPDISLGENMQQTNNSTQISDDMDNLQLD